MEAKLIVVGGDAKATEIKLKLPTIIGRGRGATLTLPHALVSRQHCEIYEIEGQLYVRDMGSLNGTFVGNEPVTEAALPPGELLTVGAVTFRAIYGELLEDAGSPRENARKPAAGKPPTVRETGNASPAASDDVQRARGAPGEGNTRPPPPGDPPGEHAAARRQEVLPQAPLSPLDRAKIVSDSTVPAIERPLPAAAQSAARPAARPAERPADKPRVNVASLEAVEAANEASAERPASGDGSVLETADIDPKAPTDFPGALPPAASANGARPRGQGSPSPQQEAPAGGAAAEAEDELQAFLRSLK